MKLHFYYKYISPLVNAFLVTAINVWWRSKTYAEPPGLLFISIFLGSAILVAFLLNQRKKDSFDGTLPFVLKRQGILFISTFFIMYVLEFVLFGIYFVAINMYHCGLPFCV
jgi:hypothetical protein